jgi:RNA polymerase sigma-70 factor (ECF subfamily)
MNSDELIAACIKGDRKAQRELYNLYAARLMAISLRYAKSTLEAEDILQESFIKIFRSLAGLKDYSNLGGWMKRILINTAINQQRGKLYMFPMVDIGYIKKGYDESVALSEFRLEELLDMIRALPAGCRMIFNLYAIEGFSHKEISDKLDISEGTSKSQYARAKFLLQKKLTDEKLKSYEKFR